MCAFNDVFGAVIGIHKTLRMKTLIFIGYTSDMQAFAKAAVKQGDMDV